MLKLILPFAIAWCCSCLIRRWFFWLFMSISMSLSLLVLYLFIAISLKFLPSINEFPVLFVAANLIPLIIAPLELLIIGAFIFDIIILARKKIKKRPPFFYHIFFDVSAIVTFGIIFFFLRRSNVAHENDLRFILKQNIYEKAISLCNSALKSDSLRIKEDAWIIQNIPDSGTFVTNFQSPTDCVFEECFNESHCSSSFNFEKFKEFHNPVLLTRNHNDFNYGKLLSGNITLFGIDSIAQVFISKLHDDLKIGSSNLILEIDCKKKLPVYWNKYSSGDCGKFSIDGNTVRLKDALTLKIKYQNLFVLNPQKADLVILKNKKMYQKFLIPLRYLIETQYDLNNTSSERLGLLSQNHIEQYIEASKFFMSQHKYQVAAGLFNKILKSDSLNGEALMRQGYAYIQMGKYSEAPANFTKIISNKSGDTAEAHLLRGSAFQKLALFDSAMQDYNCYLRIKDTNIDYDNCLYRRASCYYQRNILDSAITDCRNCSMKFEHLEYVKEMLGDIFREQGKRSQAKLEYTKALELYRKKNKTEAIERISLKINAL